MIADDVSVVVPVRDGARYLAEALASALTQCPAPLEVIVVDDGSRDGSGDIARSAGARVVEQERQGPGAARNRGVAESAGAYVAFLDADDLMLPGRLSAQASLLREDPALDCVVGAFIPFARDETGCERRAEPRAGPACATAMIRRAAFLRSGGFDAALPTAEFVDWFARLRDSGGRWASVPTAVIARRIHGENLTAERERLRAGYLEVARRGIRRNRASGAPASLEEPS